MKFDNERIIFKIHVLKIVFAFIVVLLIFLLYTLNLGDTIEKYTGMTNTVVILLLVAGYVSFYTYHLVVGTSYLYYNDNSGKIVIRFYHLRPLNPPKRSIEIPKEQFYKYAINRTSLKEEMVVYQKVGHHVSKYPPISMKGLSKKEKEMLFQSLNQYVKEDLEQPGSEVTKPE